MPKPATDFTATEEMTKKIPLIGLVIAALVAVVFRIGDFDTAPAFSGNPPPDHLRATYSPLHFQPAIATATDEQCLACHREVLDDRVRKASPAGVQAATAQAWYQEVSTSAGEQDTFHRRHLVTPMAKQLMKLSCNTCHEGHDPREEAPGLPPMRRGIAAPSRCASRSIQKTTCLKCHGQMDWKVMGLPGPWAEIKEQMGNSCVACHAVIRTNRHEVSYLDARAIEAAGQENADVCYGCHGGARGIASPTPMRGTRGPTCRRLPMH
ncbi:MAG: hypothetical protein IPL58_05890 [Betaproteobacteria bacterium]|uniref:Doubled CXXCH motif domain-containing protein n=1 Tax=Candidatus Proximibacter danicus TaxID=2954365 RepID=A0A9D7PRG1_9PROT|nr:hypothetical protein [Candidatus Proximibacter danicus]